MADVKHHIMPGITHWQHPRWDTGHAPVRLLIHITLYEKFFCVACEEEWSQGGGFRRYYSLSSEVEVISETVSAPGAPQTFSSQTVRVVGHSKLRG